MNGRQVIRFYVSSWEIGCCSPKPVVGQTLEGYKPLFMPAAVEYGWSGLDEDIDLDSLPPAVRRGTAAAGGVQRGHLLGEFHVSEYALPVRGTVLRARVVMLDRRLEASGQMYPNGESEILWQPVPESLRWREVAASDWDFDPAFTPHDAEVGDVAEALDDGVFVDLLLDSEE